MNIVKYSFTDASDNLYNIDEKRTQAKVVTGHYVEEDTGREFNYLIEVVIAPMEKEDYAGQVEIIGNINSGLATDGGEKYFEGGEYEWVDKRGRRRNAVGLRDMLNQCGWYHDSVSKTKKASVVYVNIKTPCADWLGSAGKTHINMKPYQDDLANIVTSLAKKIPTYHGESYLFSSEKDSDRSAQDYLDEFLEERKRQIDRDPSLKTKDRLTQRGVWYRIRPIMISEGFEPKKDWGETAKSLAKNINERCEKLFRLKREDLGIVASSRATMYYMGNHYPVNIDNFRELAQNGVAIIMVEKEGIAGLLYPFADKYGIAVVHTKGRFTEDGKDLIEAVKDYGSFVGILVDYDAYGRSIAEGVRTKTPIIGIDKKTITWLQQNGYKITTADIEEEYEPKIGTEDPYLQHHRIELDSVAQKVGAEGFWKYIMYRVNLLVKRLDYTNVITNPLSNIISLPTLYPIEITDLLSNLQEYTNDITETKWSEIENELADVPELIDIKVKGDEIHERLSPLIEEDKMQLIAKELEKLSELLKS